MINKILRQNTRQHRLAHAAFLTTNEMNVRHLRLFLAHALHEMFL